MLLLAGFLFIIIGLFNEIWEWKTSIIFQILISAITATILEFIVGYIVNIKLKWDIWDYSNVPFNFMGQICLPYTLLWAIVSLIAIFLDDIIRWKFFNEEKPRYTFF